MPESSILPPHNYSHNIHIQNVTQWFLSHYRSREIIRILPPPHLLRVQLNALLCRDYCSLPAEVAATGSLLISKSILLRRGMCMIPACCHTLFSPIYFCCGLENMGSWTKCSHRSPELLWHCEGGVRALKWMQVRLGGDWDGGWWCAALLSTDKTNHWSLTGWLALFPNSVSKGFRNVWAVTMVTSWWQGRVGRRVKACWGMLYTQRNTHTSWDTTALCHLRLNVLAVHLCLDFAGFQFNGYCLSAQVWVLTVSMLG